MSDDKKQNRNIEDIYFKNNKLISMPKKEKAKYSILEYISNTYFKEGSYTEKEINEIIKTFYPDFALIRRYLVDYKFISREKDCTKYFKAENNN